MRGIPALLRRYAKDAADPVGVCVNGHVHCVVNRNCCSSGHQVRVWTCVGTSGVAPIRLKCTRGISNAARARPPARESREEGSVNAAVRRHRPSFDLRMLPSGSKTQ